MNKKLLNTEIQEFISKNLTINIPSLLLKKPFFKEVSNKELAQQIAAKRKAKKKLPTWYGTSKIYFPNNLNVEQASSEITAKYKAGIVKGKYLIDLTGGFGVDSHYLSQKVDFVYHCEIHPELSQIAAHNFITLGTKNVACIHGDGISFLKNSPTPLDWIYVDPSRRDNTQARVFQLSDCTPNVTEHLELFFAKSNNILLKTSPLLDISQGIKELKTVKEIHVVAIRNEVKELLWVLQKDFQGHPLIKTINHERFHTDSFDFIWKEEKSASPTFALPQRFLYEPNAAILKSGAFSLVGKKYGLYKLQEHSHLYTSNELRIFPGRRFKIQKVMGYSKTNMRKLNIKKANLTTRNFPENVVSLQKRFHISDGGHVYLFFTRNKEQKKVVLLCIKIDR